MKATKKLAKQIKGLIKTKKKEIKKLKRFLFVLTDDTPISKEIYVEAMKHYEKE
jgi:hypothetical protein